MCVSPQWDCGLPEGRDCICISIFFLWLCYYCLLLSVCCTWQALREENHHSPKGTNSSTNLMYLQGGFALFLISLYFIKVIQTELGGSFKRQSLHRPIERPSGLLTPVTDFLCLKTRVTSCQCQPRSLVSLSTCCMPGLKVITVKAESEAFTKITMTPGRRWWVLYQWNYIYIKQAIPRRIRKRY